MKEDIMKKILIVEDVEWNLDLLVQILEEDYVVVEAENGTKGLAMAESESPDLILMDMSLPEMDGWELAGKIRAVESIREVPIIAVTAHAMAGDEEKALEAGCNGYLPKPIDEDLLIEKIGELIGTCVENCDEREYEHSIDYERSAATGCTGVCESGHSDAASGSACRGRYSV